MSMFTGEAKRPLVGSGIEMTQEEAISELCETIERELARINAKLQELLEIFREGVTVVVEKVDEK